MTTLADFNDVITAARDDIANIAADEAKQTAKIQELQDLINAGTSDGSMSAADEQAALDQITALKADLKTAADAIPD